MSLACSSPNRLPGFVAIGLVSVAVAGTLTLTGSVFAQEARPAGPAAPVPSLDNEAFKPESGQSGKDVIWVPTPDEIVDAMLDMVRIQPGDVHYDLGSGDGKIVIAAARRGAKSTGVEYNGDMVGLSQRNASRAGVSDRATFVQGDIFETDFSGADVITLYLLPTLNLKLRPTLLEMKPGTRIASHQFSMGDWEADQRVALNGRDALSWVVPARIGGAWDVTIDGESGPPLKLTVNQRYQKFQGTAAWGSAGTEYGNGRIDGRRVTFAVADPKGGAHEFIAEAADDGRMTGTVKDAKGNERKFRATRTMAVTSLPGAAATL